MIEILSFQDCSNETCEVHQATWSNDVFFIGRRGTKKMQVSIEQIEKILSACKDAELTAKNKNSTKKR